MLAGQHNPAVDLAQVVVMLCPRLLVPNAGTSERKRHAIPRHCNAVFKLLLVLWMNDRTQSHRTSNPFRWRHGCEFVGVRSLKEIGPQQDAPAATIKVRIRIGDLPDWQIGVANAAIDRLVFFPESALELQTDFDRRCIGHRTDDRLHADIDVNWDLAENGKRNGANAPVSLHQMGNPVARGAESNTTKRNGDPAGLGGARVR